MRRPVIAGNWKMYKTVPEALAFGRELKTALDGQLNGQLKTALEDGPGGVDVVLCVPFTALHPLAAELRGTGIATGAQDLHWEEQGAFTGEVSAAMLRDAGCGYALAGHSERRQLFGETDRDVNRKVRAALACGLVPIVCVGETLAERDSGVTEAVVRRQTEQGLAGLTGEQVASLAIAYEPVWAIGTGKTASDEDAQQVIAFIRGLVAELGGPATAARTRILYGGSVKPDNAAGLLAQPDIDGALVGGASLEVSSFLAIIRAAEV